MNSTLIYAVVLLIAYVITIFTNQRSMKNDIATLTTTLKQSIETQTEVIENIQKLQKSLNEHITDKTVHFTLDDLQNMLSRSHRHILIQQRI